MNLVSYLARVSLAVGLMTVAFAWQPVTAQTELHKLLAPDWSDGDWFGWSTSVSDGRCIVGAYVNDDAGAQTGSAYIFDVYTGAFLWKLPTIPVGGEEFGYSVSISGDRALIGAPSNTTSSGYAAGAAYIYDVNTGQQFFQVIPGDAAPQDIFGYAVSIDGDLAIVGAPSDDDMGTFSGSAYVVDVPTGQVIRKIVPADGMASDHFGWSVSISGNLAIIGSRWDSDVAWLAGAAYIFDVTTGQQLHQLYASDATQDAWFGWSVSIEDDRALVGAIWHPVNGPNSGAAYLFDVATGQEVARLLPADVGASDYFGYSLAVGDRFAVVGSIGATHNGGFAGAAYLFDSATGQQLAKFHGSDTIFQDNFGTGISVEGDLAVVGAFGGHTMGLRPGAAYIFDLDGPGTEFCSGDFGNGVCPCGNDNDGSVPHSGCANGVFASGAHLSGTGVASVSDDTLVLSATHVEPNNSCLFFQADNDLSPGVLWGDGLRCAGGDLRRLQVRFANGDGAASTSIGILDKAGNISTGDEKFYQCWYRNPVNPPCGAGVNDFNATNGLAVTWYP